MGLDRDDIVDYYFIIHHDRDNRRIVGWTDKKKVAEFYMKFHNCPNFEMKKITRTLEEMFKITQEENTHDEIGICNIYTRNRKKGRSDELELISIPATESEITITSQECNTFFSGRIGYSYINEAFPYLKKKYRESLEILFLDSIIKKVIHSVPDKYSSQIEMDQLMVLFKTFNSSFG